jgi:hypothetical protein
MKYLFVALGLMGIVLLLAILSVQAVRGVSKALMSRKQ